MQQILSDKLWTQIDALAKQANHKEAAVAYVSSDESIQFDKGDILVVDASDSAIELQQTSREVLATAVKKGASVYSVANLHAKVLVFDRITVIGSANISASSKERLVEAAIVTDHPETRSGALALIQQLAAGGKVVDRKFIKRIQLLRIMPRPAFAPAETPVEVRLTTSRIWIVGVPDLPEGAFPEEAESVQEGYLIAEELRADDTNDIDFLRFTGNSAFRREARPPDTVIELRRGVKDTMPVLVLRHAPILRRQDEQTCTRFYVEMDKDAEDEAISWKHFQKLAKRAGIKRALGPNTVREISPEVSDALHDLWKQ